MDAAHREKIEISAGLEAVLKAREALHTCGKETGADVVRGLLTGFAMAYRIIDPADYAVLMRELCSFPPVRGGKLEVVVDNGGSRQPDFAREKGLA